MPPILQLKTYHLRKLNISCESPKDPEKLIHHDIGIAYQVKQDKDDENLYRLHLGLRLFNSEKQAEKEGWDITIDIEGEFIMPEQFTPYQKEYAIRHNGILLLYGILRGELAAHTASFPRGRLVLPTINPASFIEEPEYKTYQDLAAQEEPSAAE